MQQFQISARRHFGPIQNARHHVNRDERYLFRDNEWLDQAKAILKQGPIVIILTHYREAI